MNDSPNVKDIVLVGGGHTHALLIRMWAMNPTPGLRLTLISPNVHTPYSGMLPGFIAGHYSFDQIHIDLHKVCAWAGVRFIQAQATAIDTRAQAIKLSIRPAIEYDICSIDIGSTPNKKIPGSEAFAVPVKPISEFAQHWLALKQQLLHNNNAAPLKVAMIGGGAGGVEIITAMQYWSKQNTCNAEFCLISRGKSLLEGYPKPLQKKLLHHLQTNDIHYKLNFDTQAIDQSHIVSDTDRHAYDKVFYCTQASAANWLRSSDLALTENGFIQVNDQLQSLRHANIFAAGDISHQVKHPSPKAGVYAVRMAPTLFNNIIHLALNKPLQAFKPQKNFLSLLALGEKTALGSRRFFSFGGKWVWRLKDKIDSQFMNQFHKLPAINMGENEKSRNKHNETALLHPNLQKQLGIQDAHELNMRCGGCGGKIGASVITKVLKELSTYHQADILIGLNSSDDAAVLNIPNDKKLVQTIDHLKTLIDDPYLFGKLSALHALSDIFAMNAQPHSAQALVQLPLASEHIQRRDMSQLMQGALEVLNQHKCTLVGGHTSEDSQLHLGFCINALANETDLLHKQGCRKGQVLILTQALGVGALFAAHMRGIANGVDIELALKAMLQSNQQAANIFNTFKASACTDVTGFGLLGHLIEMLNGENVGADLQIDSIHALSGTLEIMQAGTFSTLQKNNMRLGSAICNRGAFTENPKYPILFDPQTCGGLLASVNAEHAEACLTVLTDSGYKQSAIIGNVVELPQNGLITLL